MRKSVAGMSMVVLAVLSGCGGYEPEEVQNESTEIAEVGDPALEAGEVDLVGSVEQALSCDGFYSPNCQKSYHSKTCGASIREYYYNKTTYVWDGAGRYNIYYHFYAYQYMGGGSGGYSRYGPYAVSKYCGST